MALPPVIASDTKVPVDMMPSGILVRPDRIPSPASVKNPSYLGSFLVTAAAALRDLI